MSKHFLLSMKTKKVVKKGSIVALYSYHVKQENKGHFDLYIMPGKEVKNVYQREN